MALCGVNRLDKASLATSRGGAGTRRPVGDREVRIVAFEEEQKVE